MIRALKFRIFNAAPSDGREVIRRLLAELRMANIPLEPGQPEIWVDDGVLSEEQRQEVERLLGSSTRERAKTCRVHVVYPSRNVQQVPEDAFPMAAAAIPETVALIARVWSESATARYHRAGDVRPPPPQLVEVASEPEPPLFSVSDFQPPPVPATLHRGTDPVDHPLHYGGADDPFEAIKVIEAWGLNFSLGSALKYIRRAGHKPDSSAPEDLRKAAWYCQREAERLEAEFETPA